MISALYIGDEVSAAGFRLAGAQALVPEAGEERVALARALQDARLVLVSAAIAAQLPEKVLNEALAKPTPLCVVVPDLARRAQRPDFALRLRRQLGIDA